MTVLDVNRVITNKRLTLEGGLERRDLILVRSASQTYINDFLLLDHVGQLLNLKLSLIIKLAYEVSIIRVNYIDLRSIHHGKKASFLCASRLMEPPRARNLLCKLT